jgi:hypothetical protein
MRHGTKSGEESPHSKDIWNMACVFLLLALVGCSSDGRMPVSGAVTLDGKPLESGAITFQPVAASAGHNAGEKIENGQFRLSAAHGLERRQVLGDDPDVQAHGPQRRDAHAQRSRASPGSLQWGGPTRVEAPAGVLHNVRQQPETGRVVVHLTNYLPRPVDHVVVALEGNYKNVCLLTPDEPYEPPHLIRRTDTATEIELPRLQIYSVLALTPDR